jgi:hypothetical protein
MDIQHKTRQQIDTVKWDQCISESSNGLVYSYSFYLDNMSANWDALILGDYDAVMPLTWNRKYGIYYLYQPFLAAQLGIFGGKNRTASITAELVEKFIQAIPSKFRFVEIYLNSGNEFTGADRRFTRKSNYTLKLNKPYEDLYKDYRENNQRNVKKAVNAGCNIRKGIDIESIISLAWKQMNDHGKKAVNQADRFRNLYRELQVRAMTVTYGVFLEKKLLASAVFFYSHDRAYYILVGNHPDGKDIGASHALIDAFIKDHAGKKLLLDFEGSDIKSLAFFYSSFGAQQESYPALRINRLPFYLKWLKN